MSDVSDKLFRNGPAMVRVIDALETLKEDSGSWRETFVINLTLALYRHRLAQARKTLPTALIEQMEEEGTNT